jgi:hypothetical protein
VSRFLVGNTALFCYGTRARTKIAYLLVFVYSISSTPAFAGKRFDWCVGLLGGPWLAGRDEKKVLRKQASTEESTLNTQDDVETGGSVVRATSRPARFLADNGDGTFSLEMLPTPEEEAVTKLLVEQLAPQIVKNRGIFQSSTEGRFAIGEFVLARVFNVSGHVISIVAWSKDMRLQLRVFAEGEWVMIGLSAPEVGFSILESTAGGMESPLEPLTKVAKFPAELQLKGEP